MVSRLLTIIVLLCASPVFGQEKPQFIDRKFLVSSAIYWSGSLADICSSHNQRELNPLFQNHSGQFNAGSNLPVTAGLYAATVAIGCRWPKTRKYCNIFRFTIGASRVGFGVYNSQRR